MDSPLAISSFFHEDLGYLAALEEAGAIDVNVAAKRSAWWNLLLWWLNDELQENVQDLRLENFQSWIPQVDGRPAFNSITWLRKNERTIGIVSPVLLVRPLPSQKLSAEPWTDARPALTDGVLVRLKELHRNLSEMRRNALDNAQPLPFCSRLVDIIAGFAGKSLQDELTQSKEAITSPFDFVDPYTLRTTTVRIPRADDAFFVPRCAHCSRPLLPAEARLAVERDAVVLTCGSCQRDTALKLDAMACGWSGNELVVWQDRNLGWADQQPHSLPPVPEFDQARNRVVFSYPALASLVGIEKRELTLIMPDGVKARIVKNLRDLCYDSFLWPGTINPAAAVRATPLPVRVDNIALVRSATAGRQGSSVDVTMQLIGLPAPVRRIFLAAAVTDGHFAIYPDASKMPSGWSWYHLICDDSLRLAVPSSPSVRAIGDQMLRAALTIDRLPPVEVRNAPGPAASSCCLKLDMAEGFSLNTPPIETTTQAANIAKMQVGVDFGNSNSAVSLQVLDGVAPRQEEFNPARLRNLVSWLVTTDTEREKRESALDRLFPSAAVADPVVFPSHYCQSHNILRWSPISCCSNVQNGDVLFKTPPQYGGVRVGYLSEVLCHAAAAFCAASATRAFAIEAVFSYPLTFTDARLNVFKQEIQNVSALVQKMTGTRQFVPKKFIDEATASVLYLGAPHSEEVLLTADLGGGTLDISIGRKADDNGARDQVGSLEVGGAIFLGAIQPEHVRDLPSYVQQEIDISSGRVEPRPWFDRKDKIDAYYKGLFFYLETVAASYLLRRDADATVTRIRLYPFGNGWRFYELMVDKLILNPREFLRTQLTLLASNLQAALKANYGRNVTVEIPGTNDPAKEPLSNAKRVVARGCLAAATGASPGWPAQSQTLPIGISCKNNQAAFPWYDIFEESAASQKSVNNDITFGESELHDRLSKSPNGQQWSSARFDADTVRRDMQRDEYLQLPIGFLRSPLQILIEQEWLRAL